MYQIKEFFVNEIAPKYLSSEEINISQVGLFGYITEILSVLGEDGLNSTSIVFKECFANAAENVESLYLMAAIYQLENFFATPASMPFVMIISEDDIIENGKSIGGSTAFYIDGDTKINIDDMPFMLQYDVRITSKKTKDGYVHNAQYVMDHNLTISDITNQYIRTKVIKYNNQNYLCLLVQLRQMEVRDFEETIISNDKLNVCEYKLDLGADTQIAGFEAYYTGASSTATEVQLIKKLENTSKTTEPFCYFTMPDEGVLKISFSNDERYFVPQFNSNLRIRVYITQGKDGNFKKYTEDNINIITTPNKYEENNGLIILGQCYGDSDKGKNIPTMEEFREQVIAAQSTVLSYSTGNDLAIFFKKLIKAGNTRIMFMKRRDDSLIRLFNAFTLLTDENKVVLPTNTCDIMIEEEDIDSLHPETHRCIVKAGKIYKYSYKFDGKLEIAHDIFITDDLDKYEDDFLYTNPFLTIMSSRPVNVGLYMNSVDTTIYLDSDEVNQDSFVQFMTGGLEIHRNALLGEDDYEFKIKILPTAAELDECITLVRDDMRITPDLKTFINPYDGKTYIDRQRIKMIMCFTDASVETCYMEFELYGFDENYYFFKSSIRTDDYVAVNNKMRLIDSVKNMTTRDLIPEKFIPCHNIQANLYTFYKYTDQDNKAHKFSAYGICKGYTLTNKYTSKTTKINLITPLNMINAFLSYNQYTNLAGELTYNYRIGSVPLIKANYVKNATRFHNFVDNFTAIYEYLNSGLQQLTNNFSIDIKFYNTYGKSRHYNVDLGDDGIVPLDTTNIKLKLAIKPYYTTDIENLVADVLQYILEYMRSTFDNHGNNSYYNSNLIRSIENDFRDKIEYIIFNGINDYPLKVQKLEPIINEENLQEHYDSMLDYVPEYINPYYKFFGDKYIPQIEIKVIG